MRRSFHDFKRFMDDAGLSPSQAGTLMHLFHSQACGVSDIAENLGITVAASSQLVDRLVGEGLLERTEDPNDRRFKLVSITPKARDLIEAGIETRTVWMEQLTETLTPEEQQLITEALTLLTEAALKLEDDPA